MDATEYRNWYNKMNYDRLTIMVPKGTRERIKKVAASNGQSVNEYMKSLLPTELIDEREYVGRRTIHD